MTIATATLDPAVRFATPSSPAQPEPPAPPATIAETGLNVVGRSATIPSICLAFSAASAASREL